MNGEIVVSRVEAPLTVQEVKANVQLIQQVLREVMKEGTHFGTIPGCDKPSLWKPGAEKILSTFRIASQPTVEDLSTDDEARFRVRCAGISSSGIDLGACFGECSSSEEKYRWRTAVCEEEFEATPETHRRIKWKKGRDGGYSIKQVCTEPADMRNTVLKMAIKRAQVGMCLGVTAASDVFTQDLEDSDYPPEPDEGKRQIQPPRSSPTRQQAPQGATGLISEKQSKRLYAIYKQAGLTDEQVKAHLRERYSIGSSKQITIDMYDELVAWCERGGKDE
jgi:hypothetical protein